MGGTFIWGNSYDFLPILSGKKIIYQRTFKSAKPQLFEYSTTINGFINAKSDLERGITTTWGKKECDKSIKLLIRDKKEEIFNWFNNASSLKSSLEIANKQIEDEEYFTRWPNPKYVASFLNAKIGNKEIGLELLNQI